MNQSLAHDLPAAIFSGPPSLRSASISSAQLTPEQIEQRYSDGSIAIIRSFREGFESRLLRLPDYCQLSSAGLVEYGPHRYPIYQVRAVGSEKNPYVRLSGVVHGDEEAGGKAILQFLEKEAGEFLANFNFIANPCVNPSGYETATLQAMNGYFPEMRSEKNTGNINRSFGGALQQQEARILESELLREGRRYLFAVDMHEAPPYYQDEKYSPEDAPHQAWVYESCSDETLRIGRKLTDTLPAGLEACKWPVIYDDINDAGVIAFSAFSTGHAEYKLPVTYDAYLLEHYTPHSFTTETPTGWKLEQRIEAHLHFLRTILREYGARNIKI